MIPGAVTTEASLLPAWEESWLPSRDYRRLVGEHRRSYLGSSTRLSIEGVISGPSSTRSSIQGGISAPSSTREPVQGFLQASMQPLDLPQHEQHNFHCCSSLLPWFLFKQPLDLPTWKTVFPSMFIALLFKQPLDLPPTRKHSLHRCCHHCHCCLSNLLICHLCSERMVRFRRANSLQNCFYKRNTLEYRLWRK